MLGPKPERDTSLADYPRCDEQVKTIAGRIWGSGRDGEPSGRSYGKGWVIADRKRVRDILRQNGIGPDFAYSSRGKTADLDYIHRRSLDADIYFVSNTQTEDAAGDCTFRVTQRLPRLWDPTTGEIEPCTDYAQVPGGRKLKLRLPPAGAVNELPAAGVYPSDRKVRKKLGSGAFLQDPIARAERAATRQDLGLVLRSGRG